MSQLIIAELLESRLALWAEAQGLPVAYENIAFNPSDGPYLESHVMPATTEAIDLSRQAKVMRGVYQVNVVVPAGDGKSDAGRIADGIIETFPEGQEMSDGELTCYINSVPSAFPAITSDINYTVPVSMSYRADIS